MSKIPVNPSAAEFAAFAAAAARGGASVAPLVFKTQNDGIFAWSAFARLRRQSKYAFLLESAETGAAGRYSYVGVAPRRLFLLQNGVFAAKTAGGKTLHKKQCKDPFADLQEQTAAARHKADDSLPPFLGGVVGYAGYDCVHYFEPTTGAPKRDELQTPDMLWMQTDMLLVFDHFRHELYAVKNCYADDVGGNWRAAHANGRALAERLLARLASAPRPRLRLPPPTAAGARRPAKLPKSSHTPAQFEANVRAVKRHIERGDIFQAVPSQRFSFAQPASGLALYRALRAVNPSPYMFYLQCGGFDVVGSSPELMLAATGGHLRLRPIAGTRPRGATAKQDAALEAQLRADEKELAEHLMLVDLGRNDLGRVAQAGSVVVPPERFCRIERYSHVMHMVSDVTARLARGKTALDAARATFPAGTLSGAPKVRAMQIINKLEDRKRNLYGGFAGYMTHSGDMHTCIVIRTLVIKDGVCHAQAGGGVVADSTPRKEWQESVNKAQALLAAARKAGAKA